MQRFGSACVLIVKATENEGNVLRYRHALRPLFASVVPYGPRIVGDAMEAEEAMQDAFLKFARMRSCPQTAPQTEAWLVKTCVRGAIDRLRLRRKRASFLSELSESGRLPAEDKSRGESGWSELLDDSAGEAAVRVARIKAGLNELPDGCRLILSLCLFEGYDYAEIAEITGLKTSSVRSQYTRAKGKLLEKLQRDG